MGKQFKISEKTIANRLKQIRVNAGFTTTNEFARINDLPHSTYWQHETGQRSISIQYAAKYCSILNISLDWLILGIKDKKLAKEIT